MDFGSSAFRWAPIFSKASSQPHSTYLIGLGIIHERMGQATLHFEIEIAPLAQFRHRVTGEKIGRAAVAGQFPDRRLGAVFAKFEHMRDSGLSPGAGGAHMPLRLVLARQGFEHRRTRHFARENLADAYQRSPAARRAVIGIVSTGWSILLSRPDTWAMTLKSFQTRRNAERRLTQLATAATRHRPH